jgi:hypothetical protein
MIMLIFTLSFLIIALNLGGQAFVWNSPMIIGMFCVAGVSFVAFVIAEKYAKMPVAPLRLFVQWQWRNVPLILGQLTEFFMFSENVLTVWRTVIRSLMFFHLFSTVGFHSPFDSQHYSSINIMKPDVLSPEYEIYA